MSDDEAPEVKALRQLHDFATATGSTYADVLTFAGIFKRLNDAEAERDAALEAIACCDSRSPRVDGTNRVTARIYTTDIHGVGIRREPDWVNVEDLEKAGRKVFTTKGDKG